MGPGGIISLFTLEELDLPDDIAATAFAMNVMSSEGVLVLNPGHVDPGFRGPLTVRIINIRATPKALVFGTPIFTVIFERLPKPTRRGYRANKPRTEREIAFEATDVEQNPKTLLGLLNAGDERPLMTPQEVDRRIMKHWVTLTVLIFSAFATVLAFAAAIFAAIALLPKQKTEPPVLNRSMPRFSAKPSAPVFVAPTPSASPTKP